MALNAELEELVVQNFPKEGEGDLKGSMNIKKVTEGKGELEIPGTEIKISFPKR